MTPYELFDYDLDVYPFDVLVSDSLGLDSHRWAEHNLKDLSADLPRRTWQTDQQSPWHASFYTGFDGWHGIFDRFVREMAVPRMGEPCYYQRVPTFRVQLPKNTAVGAFHTDAEYNHPCGEVSFWVPLTELDRTSTLWIADDDQRLVHVDARPGQVAQFSAVSRVHGNVVNATRWSRVSFDFRLMPVRLLPTEEGPPTKHTELRFVPGGYYAEEVVG